METTPYIGASISLVSKAGIRYEGTLFTIDTQQSNLALQNVRSFGTEGRKKDGPQVPAGNEVYDYINFRGTDIQDLQVLEQPNWSGHMDPAIVNTGMPPYYTPQPYGPPGGYPRGPGGAPPPGMPWGQPYAPQMMAPYGPPQTQWSSGYYPMGMPQQPQPPMQQQPMQQPSQQQGHMGPQGAHAPPQPPAPALEPPKAAPPKAPTPQAVAAPAPPAARPAVPTVPVPAPPPLAPAPTMPKAATPAERPRPSSYANAAGALSSGGSSAAAAAAQRAAPHANGNGMAAPRPRGPPAGPPGAPAGGRGYSRPPVAAIVVPNEDFDFQKNLQKFNKPHIAPEKAAGGGYNKDDFFDNITTDKGDGGRHNERHTNVQTFGSLSITQAPPSLPTYQSRPPQGGRGAGPVTRTGGPGPGRGSGGYGGRGSSEGRGIGPAGGRSGGAGRGAGSGRGDGQRRIPTPNSVSARS